MTPLNGDMVVSRMLHPVCHLEGSPGTTILPVIKARSPSRVKASPVPGIEWVLQAPLKMPRQRLSRAQRARVQQAIIGGFTSINLDGPGEKRQSGQERLVRFGLRVPRGSQCMLN